MPLIIPTREDPYYQQRTRIEGRDYVLNFAFNEREARWYLTIADEAGSPIATGIKLVANRRLLRPYRYDDRCPPGELVVSDISGDGSPPTQLEIGEGKRCELLYWTAAEVAAIQAESS
jgi:hypothetical protein